MGTRSIYRELGQHHAPLVRPLGEASRRAEPEPASGRASKLWLPTARVVDIGYCGYSEPFGGAGEGHTGLRLGLASPYLRIRRYEVGVRSSPKWTGFTRFYKTVICMGMHAFHGNGKGSRSAPAIQFIVQPKSLLSGARLRSVLRTHCIRSAKSLLYRGAHAYKTRPESGHRFTPRLDLRANPAPVIKVG